MLYLFAGPGAQTSTQDETASAEPTAATTAVGEEVKAAAPKPVPLMDYILNVVGPRAVSLSRHDSCRISPTHSRFLCYNVMLR